MARTGTTFKITDKGVKDLAKDFFGKSVSVKVGVFGAKGAEKVKPREEGQPAPNLTMVELATIHEFGTGKIPERSFIRSYFDAEFDSLMGVLRKLIEKAIARAVQTGKPITAAEQKKVLDTVGAYMVGRIQERIASGAIKPPLAETTIDRKGSSKPLIDTGQLRSSITFEVE